MNSERTTKQPTKKAKPVDLSAYEEEAIPFDAVIRRLANVPAAKPKKKAKKRAK